MNAPVTYTRAQVGISAPQVTVETHLTGGIPRFTIVGLPEAAVKESKERVRSALMNSQFEFPRKRITTNLAPADIPKIGGRYDLAIAMGILAASKQIPLRGLDEYEFAAELGLSGELRPVSGVLSAAVAASEKGRVLVVAPQNADEAVLLGGNRVYACESLLALCQHLQGKEVLDFHEQCFELDSPIAQSCPDLADVCGHLQPKRVLAIAGAGAHSLLMVGPPGTGKSLLSHCLPGILPELTRSQALEVAAIHSLANGGVDMARWRLAPYCAPHHTSSSVALVGGGKVPKPGLISQAHHGILFLDELPEFRRDVLEALREPLENGHITVARAAGHVSYPARFQLVAAMNPCPCGYLGDPQHECRCSPQSIERYQNKISGPLLDRIDLHVLVRPVPMSALVQHEKKGPTSHEVRGLVLNARMIQEQRQGCANSAITQNKLQLYCEMASDAQKVLADAIEKFGLSPRSYHRVLRVSRTIADLEWQELIASQHVAEALSYRNILGVPSFSR